MRLTSVDRIFADGIPGGGEATGQPAGMNIRNTMNVETDWARAFGLEMVAYEGGWSVGGDEGARNGVEYDAELLKYTEGNGNDGFVG